MDPEAILERVLGPARATEGARPSQMTRQEQLVVLGLTAASLLGGVSILALQAPAVIPLLLAACALTLLAIRKGNRMVAGLALVLTGAVAFYVTSPLLVLPHYAYAMFMIVFRMNRQVKLEQQAKAAERRATRDAQRVGPAGRGKAAKPVGPPPSKRYTPPKAKKAKPGAKPKPDPLARGRADEEPPTDRKGRFGRRGRADVEA